MFGHIHKDTEFVKDGITAISTANILNANSEWDDEDSRILGGWDFITIDKKSRVLNRKGMGYQVMNERYVYDIL